MYDKFKKIDGTHPWRKVSPHGFIDYPVRYREGGHVLYFNYSLAREMGLIARNHPAKMNAKLEKRILETFSLQIINEYDQAKNTKFSKQVLRKHPRMATRYLQAQHKNKQGKTSGDGRSIWNGYLKTRNLIFDISSGGTGNTILSPGSQIAGQPVKTGDETHGYSSGLAEVDEMLSSAIMSEIFYREDLPTERCLVVIDYDDNTAIGVRTAPNLIRPAHIFRYLKQGSWEELKSSFDYFLKRQQANKVFKLPKKGRQRYSKALNYLAKTYARLAATMEEEYIFNWLAWDGDNMLADGAILDYGSIRQFAAKHDKYRYDDVDRFSTCLTEQKREARKLIQTFAQAIDFINTKKKKNLRDFAQHKSLSVFDQFFELERQKRMLLRMGFNHKQIGKLIIHHQNKIQTFRRLLNYFEDLKTQKGLTKVPDGVDHPPIFLVRHILRELPIFILRLWKVKKRRRMPVTLKKGSLQNQTTDWPMMPPEEFCAIMAASYIGERELKLTESRAKKAVEFQEAYKELIYAAGPYPGKTLRSIVRNSSVINYAHRATGDGITWICNEAVAEKDKMNRNHFQQVIDRFIESQVLVPGKWKAIHPDELDKSSPKAKHLRRIHETVKMYNENI